MKSLLQIICQVPGFTGSGVYLQAIVSEAARKGYRQGLVAGIPKQYNPDPNLNRNQVKLFPAIFNTKELPFPVVGMSDVMPYPSTTWKELREDDYRRWIRAFSKALEQAVHAFEPDFVISHHIWVLSSLFKDLFPDLRLVTICHGTDIAQLNEAIDYSGYVIEKSKEMKAILASSEYQKEQIERYYSVQGNNIFTAPPGIDPEIHYPPKYRPKGDEIRLVYAGKLSMAKGTLSLLRAYGRLKDADVMTSLRLIGSSAGDELDSIKKLAMKLGAEITEHVSQTELADCFRNSDIFVLPSCSEGFSLVLLEALACGLRVVSTDLPAVRSWLPDSYHERGIVEFVELPSTECITEVDIPLTQFEDHLCAGIRNQIDRILDKPADENSWAYEILKEYCWERTFEKIEGSLKTL